MNMKFEFTIGVLDSGIIFKIEFGNFLLIT
jgi:hypothetical protein